MRCQRNDVCPHRPCLAMSMGISYGWVCSEYFEYGGYLKVIPDKGWCPQLVLKFQKEICVFRILLFNLPNTYRGEALHACPVLGLPAAPSPRVLRAR